MSFTKQKRFKGLRTFAIKENKQKREFLDRFSTAYTLKNNLHKSLKRKKNQVDIFLETTLWLCGSYVSPSEVLHGEFHTFKKFREKKKATEEWKATNDHKIARDGETCN